MTEAFVAFAAFQFELNAPQDDGATLRDHLEMYQASTGMMHPIMKAAPHLPAGCEYLWSDFMDMHSTRQFRDSGPAPISFLDIDAWQRVNGVALQPWQLNAIRRADAEFLRATAKAVKRRD